MDDERSLDADDGRFGCDVAVGVDIVATFDLLGFVDIDLSCRKNDDDEAGCCWLSDASRFVVFDAIPVSSPPTSSLNELFNESEFRCGIVCDSCCFSCCCCC